MPCKCPEASEAELDRVSSSIQDCWNFGAFLKMEDGSQFNRNKIGHIWTYLDDLLGEP